MLNQKSTKRRGQIWRGDSQRLRVGGAAGEADVELVVDRERPLDVRRDGLTQRPGGWHSPTWPARRRVRGGGGGGGGCRRRGSKSRRRIGGGGAHAVGF